jgi:NAD(P)-dependent dehydrogenase (short-subunit alcohol dehydrogenase family)
MTIAFTCSGGTGCESLAGETGATLIERDERDRASADQAVERALGLGDGRLDVLVTNAHRRPRGSIEATPERDFCDLLEANLTAPFRVARASFEPMCAQGAGSLILIASGAGIRAAHETAAYSVMSAGVIAVAELFAAEGAAHGVRCNAVCPDGIATDGAASARVDQSNEVAALVAWLASDESSHMSGATLRIDRATGAAMVADTRG